MIIDLNFQVCKKRFYPLHGKVKTEALEKAGLQIAERVPIEVESQEPAAHYLKTKKEKMGHLINF